MAINQMEKMASRNAEATVIGTILKHPEFTMHSEMLKPSYFYNSENGCWLWAINELYKKGITNIDVLNISNMLESNPGVSKLMKQRNINNIAEYIKYSSIAARDTVEEYMIAVKEVVTMAYKRDLYSTLSKILNQCLDETIDLKALETSLNTEVNKVTEKYIIDDNMETFGSIVKELWEEIVSNRNEDGTYGIPTIFQGLTDKGLVHERGEMILLTAQRKVGKSLILLNETVDKLKNGMACIYHDTEMSDRLFLIRMLSNITGVTQWDIKNGTYNYSEDKKLREALDWIEKVPFKHIYAPNFSENEIYQQYKIFQYKYGNNMIGVYDYFKATGDDSSINYNQLGRYANFLKNNIAGGLDIPILAAAQLNREGKIADSFRLEMIASAGITYRPKTKQEILDSGGNEFGNMVLHIDFARSAEAMGDDEYLHIKVDGSRMRAEQAKQPKPKSPFYDEEESDE